MRFTINRNTALFLTTLATAALGGCSGCQKTAPAQSELTPAEEIHTILEQPQRFDAQSIEELAQKVRDNADFSAAELANMMIQTEAISNKVSMEAERLMQVEDAADTFWTLKDIAESGWWNDYKTVYAWLEQAQLPDEVASRFGLLKQTNIRVNQMITQLEHRDLKGENKIDI